MGLENSESVPGKITIRLVVTLATRTRLLVISLAMAYNVRKLCREISSLLALVTIRHVT